MNGPRIAIVGDGVEAWLFAALFRQLSRRTGTLVVIPPPQRRETGRIALPPVVADIHRLLRIAPDLIAGFGTPRYGIEIAIDDGSQMLIPYGSYGDPDEPGNLVNAWIRLHSEGDAPALAGLSANAALAAGGSPRPDADPHLLRSIVAGWDVDGERYRATLKDAALARGVECSGSAFAPDTLIDADLIVDASEGHAAPQSGVGWHGRWLRIGTAAHRLHDAEPFAIAAVFSAAARLVSLLPRPDAMALLAREYNRQLAIELEGMEAASAMLERLFGQEARSVALDRHEARYRIAGLLPADPQPWTRDMWLSAFDAMGWRPERYDPNLDRFDTDRSTRRFDEWAALIDRYLPGRP
jgi:hypothetical protein